MTRPERSDRLEEYAEKLRDLLFADEARPITAPALAAMLGLPPTPSGAAVVRQAARLANFQGVPIVADERGFWVATTPAEVRTYRRAEIDTRITALSSRGRALDAIVAQMERPDARPMYQGTIFDMPDGPECEEPE